MMSVLRRPVLLLSAAATVAVPSLLALFALLGHEHAVEAAAHAQAASLGAGVPGGGAAPLPASLGAGARNSVPSARAGAGSAVGTSQQQAQGMSLLRAAAAAGLATSYQGVELVDQATVDGSATVVSSVWHLGGGPTYTETSDSAAAARGSAASYDVNGREPEGVFGITTDLVTLLVKHYVAVYGGAGSVIGRPAVIVEVRRDDGSLAARLWLDKQTKLPLRKDVYDTSSRLVSDDKFVRVRFGAQPRPAGASRPVSPAQADWTSVPAAALLRKLNGAGWHLPAVLPGGLDLYSAAQATMPSGPVVDLGYSDGLSVVSLFVQRGVLPATMPGWQPARIAGQPVYVAQHGITLSGQGFVYTLIADEPPQTATATVAALVRDATPGFLGRLGRGLSRLVAWVDPFR